MHIFSFCYASQRFIITTQPSEGNLFYLCTAADRNKMRISSKHIVQKISRLAQSNLYMSLLNIAVYYTTQTGRTGYSKSPKHV